MAGLPAPHGHLTPERLNKTEPALRTMLVERRLPTSWPKGDEFRRDACRAELALYDLGVPAAAHYHFRIALTTGIGLSKDDLRELCEELQCPIADGSPTKFDMVDELLRTMKAKYETTAELPSIDVCSTFKSTFPKDVVVGVREELVADVEKDLEERQQEQQQQQQQQHQSPVPQPDQRNLHQQQKQTAAIAAPTSLGWYIRVTKEHATLTIEYMLEMWPELVNDIRPDLADEMGRLGLGAPPQAPPTLSAAAAAAAAGTPIMTARQLRKLLDDMQRMRDLLQGCLQTKTRRYDPALAGATESCGRATDVLRALLDGRTPFSDALGELGRGLESWRRRAGGRARRAGRSMASWGAIWAPCA